MGRTPRRRQELVTHQGGIDVRLQQYLQRTWTRSRQRLVKTTSDLGPQGILGCARLCVLGSLMSDLTVLVVRLSLVAHRALQYPVAKMGDKNV